MPQINGLKYLAPNQKIQFFLTNLAENYEEKLKRAFEIKITYENCCNKKYSNIYLMDFSQRSGTYQLGKPPLYKIATSIENIEKDINNLSTGFKKLEVIRYTKEDIKEEERKRFEQIGS